MQDLIDRIKPKFQSNLHSFGQWLLYPQGWQVGTDDADNPLYVALGGTDANPAIPGFNPGQSADTLYVTNGETTDYADTTAGTVAYTPELGEGAPGAGFVFPDNEALIQAEFQRTLPSTWVWRGPRGIPRTPTHRWASTSSRSTSTRTTSIPRTGSNRCSTSNSTLLGDPQEVRVLAKRSLNDMGLKNQVNGGAVHTARPANGRRERTARPRVYYHVIGHGDRHRPGDKVKVWFAGGGETSDSFTYDVRVGQRPQVLILAAEDYTGASQLHPPGTTRPTTCRGTRMH